MSRSQGSTQQGGRDGGGGGGICSGVVASGGARSGMEDAQPSSQRYIREMLNIALIRGPEGKAGFLLRSLGSRPGPLSVASIAEDGTAARCGLLVSDLLHAVDGRNVEKCGLKGKRLSHCMF